MNFFSALKKTKKRRILVVSAGGPQSGIQCIYFCAEGDAWESVAHAILPYPDPVEQLVETLALNPAAAIGLDRLAWLDQRLSYLFLECARTALSHAHKSMRQPHFVVMNPCTLFRGPAGDGDQARVWDVTLGDAQLLASALKVPVITGFGRHGILAGADGGLPLFPGNAKIAKHAEPVSLYLNIGLVAHMAVVDNQAMAIVLDSDIGPGTCLINLAAREAGCQDGFDRDGSFAAKGKVDSACLGALMAHEWFSRPAPKQAFLQELAGLYSLPQVAALSPLDRLATLTALTARSAFEFFKREYRQVIPAEVVWLSGGGANNLTLIEYLGTYFDPVKVKSVEESGIPAALRIPLALGLSVHEYISGHRGPWNVRPNPEIRGIGRWVFP